MKTGRKACYVAALMLAIGLLACGCGSAQPRSMQRISEVQQTLSAAPNDTSAQVAEVLAAPAPEGVDFALWDTLKNQLARELGVRNTSQATEEELPAWDRYGMKCVSEYDNGDRSVVWDTSFFRGDGSQNGVVDVADLATIAQHFGQYTLNTPLAEVADYNDDWKVGIADISVLAKNFGKTCASFKVEISVVSRRSDYSTSGTRAYSEAVGVAENGCNEYRFTFPSGIIPIAWIRVTAYDAASAAIAYDTCVLRYDTGHHPYFPVDDLAVSYAPTGRIAWSSAFFEGDGSGDGRVSEADITPIAMHWNQHPADNPNATAADYDKNGIVDILDWDCVDDHHGESCAGFTVEVSAVGPASGFTEDGSPTFSECVLDGWNDFGFRDFEYTLQSPPAMPYWVRVTPIGYDGTLGLPSAAMEFGV